MFAVTLSVSQSLRTCKVISEHYTDAQCRLVHSLDLHVITSFNLWLSGVLRTVLNAECRVQYIMAKER
jgi:hypothetical protein